MPTLLGETRDRRVSVQDQGDRTTYSETFEVRVKADYKEQPREEILATPGLPIVGVTVSPNGLGYCKSLDAKTESVNPLYWLVTFEYSTPDPGKQANTGSPVDFQPIATVNFDLIDEVSLVDANGDAVVNSAGQTFESGFVIKRPVTHYSFTQYEPSSLSLQTIRERNGVLNQNTYPLLDADPGELLLMIESAEIGTYYNLYCWRIRYKMTHKDFGWKIKRLDRGSCYKDGTTLVPYTDGRNNRIIGNLDGSGAKSGNDGTDPPAILTFSHYRDSDLSFLRLS